MSEAEAIALFKMADFTPPSGVSTQEAYDLLQGRAAEASASPLDRDTSKEEAAAVKLTAVGTFVVCYVAKEGGGGRVRGGGGGATGVDIMFSGPERTSSQKLH